MAKIFNSVLELSALILGIINGLFLLFLSVRNRPILKVFPIFEESIRYFHAIQVSGDQEKNIYGYIAHIRVINKGNKDISFSNWNLKVKTREGWKILFPISIPNPEIKIGTMERVIDVIGINGNNRLKSGDEITGFVCYFTLSEPKTGKDNIARGEIEIVPVYGKKAKATLVFKPISHKGIAEIIPNFENVMADYLQKVN